MRWSGVRELDRDYAASFLMRGRAPGRTPYRGIFPAPTGEAILMGAQGEQSHRFWDVPADRELHLAGDREYEEGLLHLFREAVDVRTRPHARVCAELSGGLDSSSVVSMAAQLGADLTTVSFSVPGSNDQKFIDAVERSVGGPALHLPLDDYPLTSPEQTGGAMPGWWEPRLRWR